MAVMLCQLALSDALPYDTSSLRIHIDPRGTYFPRLSERFAMPPISIHAPPQSHLAIASSHMHLMTRIRHSQPAQRLPAQGS